MSEPNQDLEAKGQTRWKKCFFKISSQQLLLESRTDFRNRGLEKIESETLYVPGPPSRITSCQPTILNHRDIIQK